MQKYKIGDFVLYGYSGACEIVEIGPLSFGGNNRDYYSLKPVYDERDTIYVPVDKGKRIETGQTIQIVPSGVDAQESGSLVGVVRTVSSYPVSLKSVEQQIGNPELSQRLMASGQGAVMEVRFILVRDENSPSGYLWTSVVGPHKPVSAGSFFTGSIIIERRPPIEKVFYKISQWLRNR